MKKRDNISIIDFVTDPQLLGLSISEPQEVLLRSIYGLPLSKSQLDSLLFAPGAMNTRHAVLPSAQS